MENRVLTRMFRPKGGEEKGERRKLRNEELHDFHSTKIIYYKKGKAIPVIGCEGP
jgi:hypothetical protein